MYRTVKSTIEQVSWFIFGRRSVDVSQHRMMCLVPLRTLYMLRRAWQTRWSAPYTSEKETSFSDLNIKVIGSYIHTSVYDKRDDFGFPIVNILWLSGDVSRLPSYEIHILQLVRFARCCTNAKRLKRRHYDPAIIERTIGLVFNPSTALYRSFLNRCTLTNKAVGTIWRTLSNPPQWRQSPEPRSRWLLVETPSVFGPELAHCS